MELTVYKISGEATGKKVQLNDDVFAVEPNDHAIYLDVKRIMANKRQGTHKAKEKWEVNFSTKKIKKQKGTGGARAGSRKNPLFRKGGRVFGPKPRTYDTKLNQKVKELARFSALSYKAKGNGIVVLEDFNFESPKTTAFTSLMASHKVQNKKLLLVLAEPDNNIYLSSRNLQGVKVVTASDLNTYDIMDCGVLMFNESAISNF